LDYDFINEWLTRAYSYYISSAQLLLTSDRAKLLRSESIESFTRNLQILNEAINMPVCVTSPRNVRTDLRSRIDLRKIQRLDWSVLDEIYFQADACPDPINVSKQDFDFVVQKPKHFEEIETIFADSTIEISSDKSYILWLDQNPAITFCLQPDKVSKRDLFIRPSWGGRKDLNRHVPFYHGSKAKIPSRGVGLPLRQPFGRWTFNSNSQGRPLGTLISYQIDYL